MIKIGKSLTKLYPLFNAMTYVSNTMIPLHTLNKYHFMPFSISTHFCKVVCSVINTRLKHLNACVLSSKTNDDFHKRLDLAAPFQPKFKSVINDRG